MSEQCNHDCGSCGSDCAERDPKSFLEKPHQLSSIKKVIGVVSGKGGVGKSLVTGLLAVAMSRQGARTAVLDADITGPSVPKMFGIKEKAMATEQGILPRLSKTGIQIMSANLLLEQDTDPVIWRGPVIAGTVKQFWTEVIWEDVDYMFVDMPPGTGDVPLTVFQSLPVDGIIIVTSPQELVSMIVAKAVNMAKMMNVPILGLIENFSYIKCPHCDEKYPVFGESHIDEVAAEHKLKVLGKLPVDPAFTKLCDGGEIEFYEGDQLLKDAVCAIAETGKEQEACNVCFGETTRKKIAVTFEDQEIFQHFGKSKRFAVYTAENNVIRERMILDCGESGHSALAELLDKNDIDVLICGGIGGGAKDALKQRGIELVAGAQGNADEAVEAYLNGTLVHDADFTCSHHEHHQSEGHTCGDHDHSCC